MRFKKYFIALLLVTSLFLFAACKKNEGGVAKTVSPDFKEFTDLEFMDKLMLDEFKTKHKGKKIIVNFFASWCPPCRAEMPDFVEVYNERKEDLVILGLTIDDNKDDAIRFINDFGVTYPTYISDKKLQYFLNVLKVPTSFLYDEKGNFVQIFEGMMSKQLLLDIANTQIAK